MTDFKAINIPLNGKLISSEDPILIGANFSKLENMRYTDTNPQGIGGMTKINTSTTNITGYLKIRSGFHFRKAQPSESHILTQNYNAGENASQVFQNTTTIPNQGNFSATSLWTDSSGSGRGIFSDAPGGQTAYCNGVDSCLWGGVEMRTAAFINYDPNGNFSYDYTKQINNTINDANNVASLQIASGGGIDANAKLMLHMDGVNGSSSFVDSASGVKAITANGNAQISTASFKFATAAGLFDGAGDYLTTPDHADFDFSGGNWAIDFWASVVGAGTAQTVYAQGTDANNYMEIVLDGTNLTCTLNIVAAGVNVVQAQTPTSSFSLNTWTHFEISENGNNYRIYVNGVQAGYVSDADRAANYNQTVKIGSNWNAAANDYNGYLDEYRVSNVERHSVNFEPLTSAYAAAQNVFVYVGSTRPLQGFKIYIGTANGAASTMSVNYWNGSVWTAVSSLSDGTSLAGKSLAQTGTVSFTSTVSTAKLREINGIYLYWYQIVVTAVSGSPTIYYFTVNAPFQAIKDVPDGDDRIILSFQEFNGTNFSDLTINVADDTYSSNNTVTFAVLSSLTTSQYLVAGFNERMMALRIHTVDGQENTTANTVAKISYWNGTAWTSVGQLTDGTFKGNASLGQSGLISWNPPAEINEFRTKLTSIHNTPNDSGEQLYYYKIQFSQQLDTSTQIYYVAGIPAPKTILGYNYPVMANDRLWLLGENLGQKNKAICSSRFAPDVYNGKDSVEFFFGDESALTGGAHLYTNMTLNIYNITVFFKANETWAIIGNGPQDWIQYQVSKNIGCIAPQTIQIVNLPSPEEESQNRQVVIFQSSVGLHMFDGRVISPIFGDIHDIFIPTPTINTSKIDKSVGFLDWPNIEYHWLFNDTGSSYSSAYLNREMVYDLLRHKWYEIKRGANKELICGFGVKDTTGYSYAYGGLDTGYIERLNNGTDFDGTAITCIFQTTITPTNNIMYETRLRGIKLVMKSKTTTTNNVSIDIYADGSATSITTTMSPVSSGNTRADVFKVLQFKNAIFHTIKCTMTTNNESIGFEPLLMGAWYETIRMDLN